MTGAAAPAPLPALQLALSEAGGDLAAGPARRRDGCGGCRTRRGGPAWSSCSMRWSSLDDLACRADGSTQRTFYSKSASSDAHAPMARNTARTRPGQGFSMKREITRGVSMIVPCGASSHQREILPRFHATTATRRRATQPKGPTSSCMSVTPEAPGPGVGAPNWNPKPSLPIPASQ